MTAQPADTLPEFAHASGQRRVIIEHVSPELDAGRYPIKALPGETIPVEADIFSDGHNLIAARLRYKHSAESDFQEVAMHELGNDRWAASFVVEHIGRYAYQIEAWVDHLASWKHKVELRLKDSQHITSELLAGAAYLDAMTARAQANPADAAAIADAAELFRSESRYDEAIAIARSSLFTYWLTRYPERQHASQYHELGVEVDRKRAGFSTWYCLFPRSTSPVMGQHGTFRDVERLLPRIANMGFNVLYLPPIHPIGSTHRKGKNNSATCMPDDPGVPYSIGSEEGGHDAIHAELGTVDDFRQLVAQAKAYGMEVALDFAIQYSPDHPYTHQHPDWFQKRPDGTIQYAENPPEQYQDIYPLYFETDNWQQLWIELKRVLLVWADWGVRMVRVDNPHTKPFGFWEWIIAEVKRDFPDMIFLAESFTKPKSMQTLAKLGYAQSYTYFTWRTTKAELEQYMTELTQTQMRHYYRPNFWPTTHDFNPPYLHGGHEPQFVIRYFLAATLSSNYGIFGPSFELLEHMPFPGKDEYLNSEKYEIRYWDWNRTNKLTYLITLINRIRTENPALQTTNNYVPCLTSTGQIMAYAKTLGQNRLLCIVNLDAYHRQSAMVHVPLQLFGLPDNQPYTAEDLLTGAHYVWQGSQNYVELDPYLLPMHLLRIDG